MGHKGLYKRLKSMGYRGTSNDQLFAYLGHHGFTGTLNDRMSKFLKEMYPEKNSVHAAHNQWCKDDCCLCAIDHEHTDACLHHAKLTVWQRVKRLFNFL